MTPAGFDKAATALLPWPLCRARIFRCLPPCLKHGAGDEQDFLYKIKPLKGQPLTCTALGLVLGQDAATLQLMPSFRLD